VPRIEPLTLVEPEDFGLMERFEVHGVGLAHAIRLAGRPDAGRIAGVANGQQQGQSQVVAQNPVLADAMELVGVDIHCIVGNRPSRLGESMTSGSGWSAKSG